MQLIVVYETKKNAKTDGFYFNRYLDDVFPSLKGHIKKSAVYSGSKTRYAGALKTIVALQKKYAFLHPNERQEILYCVDTDFGKEGALELNERIASFCKEHGFRLVWFHRDIEEVFLGERVDKREKVQRAKRFACDRNGSYLSNAKRFEAKHFVSGNFGSSNLHSVLSQIFPKI